MLIFRPNPDIPRHMYLPTTTAPLRQIEIDQDDPHRLVMNSFRCSCNCFRSYSSQPAEASAEPVSQSSIGGHYVLMDVKLLTRANRFRFV